VPGSNAASRSYSRTYSKREPAIPGDSAAKGLVPRAWEEHLGAEVCKRNCRRATARLGKTDNSWGQNGLSFASDENAALAVQPLLCFGRVQESRHSSYFLTSFQFPSPRNAVRAADVRTRSAAQALRLLHPLWPPSGAVVPVSAMPPVDASSSRSGSRGALGAAESSNEVVKDGAGDLTTPLTGKVPYVAARGPAMGDAYTGECGRRRRRARAARVRARGARPRDCAPCRFFGVAGTRRLPPAPARALPPPRPRARRLLPRRQLCRTAAAGAAELRARGDARGA
jgi:hypothetical protein